VYFNFIVCEVGVGDDAACGEDFADDGVSDWALVDCSDEMQGWIGMMETTL
jgi:hypothetical protein